VPDAAGEVAFEAAQGFAVGLAFGAFAGEVVARFGVAARAGDGDAVDGVRAQDLATVKRVAASRAAAKGIALVVAAGIGPNSSVVQDDADQPALSKTA
jgi:hypothetical protein